MELALAGGDRQVVDRGEAMPHQAALVELPVLVAVGAEPVARIVAPFVREAHGDAVAAAGPQLFDQAVVQFPGPFAGEERLDRLTALEELRTVPPHAVRCVGKRHAFGIPAVPRVFGGARLDRRRLGREGRQRRSCGIRHGRQCSSCMRWPWYTSRRPCRDEISSNSAFSGVVSETIRKRVSPGAVVMMSSLVSCVPTALKSW